MAHLSPRSLGHLLYSLSPWQIVLLRTLFVSALVSVPVPLTLVLLVPRQLISILALSVSPVWLVPSLPVPV